MSKHYSADQLRSGGEMNPFKAHLEYLEARLAAMDENIQHMRNDLKEIKKTYTSEYRRPK